MSKKLLIHLSLLITIIGIILAFWWVFDYIISLPENVSQQETIVVGQKSFVPGSNATFRILTREISDATPISGAEISVSIENPDGNRRLQVYRGKTDHSGDAVVVFQVPEIIDENLNLIIEVSSGFGSDLIERPIKIERDYKVLLTTDKLVYQPGQLIHLRALALSAFDMVPASMEEIVFTISDGRGNKVFQWLGETSEWGIASIDFQLATLVNTGLYNISASIADSVSRKGIRVDHEMSLKSDIPEISNIALQNFDKTIVIEAIPEGGDIQPGLENILYVFTSYQDGSPAETTLTIDSLNSNDQLRIDTDVFGLAKIPFVPKAEQQKIYIKAEDRMGNSDEGEFLFEGFYHLESILIRPDKPVYRVGDTMGLTVLSTDESASIYLDITRDGQTINSQVVTLDEGFGRVEKVITPDLSGLLELHAYKILSSGNIIHDKRVMVVDHPDSLNIDLMLGIPPDTDRLEETEHYSPGETALMKIQTTSKEGIQEQSAVGLSIVNVTDYPPGEIDPGFVKLYFMLEKALLPPKYDLHGYSIPDLIMGVPVSSQSFIEAIEDAAFASFAEAIPEKIGFSLQASSYEDAIYQVEERQQIYFGSFARVQISLFVVVAAVFLILGILSILKEQIVKKSLVLSISLITIPVLLILFWPHPLAANPIEKLDLFFALITRFDLFVFVPVVVFSLLGIISLIILYIRERDYLLGWYLGLLPVSSAILLFFMFTQFELDNIPDGKFLIVGGIGFISILLSLLLRFSAYLIRKRKLAAASIFLIGLFFGIGIFQLYAIYPDLTGRGLDFMEEISRYEVEVTGSRQGERDIDAAETVLDEADKQEMSDDLTLQDGLDALVFNQFFPETMLWQPDLITDDRGLVELEFQIAESIADWKVTALASTQDGRLGGSTANLRVFQDFFVVLDLPASVTILDEISVPVRVQNNLDETQEIRLEVHPSEWFELLDSSEEKVEVTGNGFSTVYFRIRVTSFGYQTFKATASGTKVAYSFQKEIQVKPDGMEISISNSGKTLTPSQEGNFEINEIIEIPEDAIPKTQKIGVKIYPSAIARAFDSVNNISQVPGGSFEEIASSTYLSVLVLDYLKSAGLTIPEIQRKAEENVYLGYQRLTTYEVGRSGGFSMYGDKPADPILTAYGLQLLSDLGRIWYVDPELIQRSAEWLYDLQNEDGSWENERGLGLEMIWDNLENDRLPVTAFIVWSLIEAGFFRSEHTHVGMEYLQEFGQNEVDPYILSLMANAMVAFDINTGAEITEPTLELLDRLVALSISDGSTVIWRNEIPSYMGSEGQVGSIETTALAAMAFLRANRNQEIATSALAALLQMKDNNGRGQTTQGTMVILKALLQSVHSGVEPISASVKLTMNDDQSYSWDTTSTRFDKVREFTFNDVEIGRENNLNISLEGKGDFRYQVSGIFYIPWDSISKYPQLTGGSPAIDIVQSYEKTVISNNDTLAVNMDLSLREGRAENVLLELGIPPGFSAVIDDLTALVSSYDDVTEGYAFPTIEHFEIKEAQIFIFISNLSSDHPLEFSYRLRANFPSIAKTPPCYAYDTYNPGVYGVSPPQLIIVNP
jgi:hypothetical protein